MAVKSVIEIDVRDEAFKAFVDMFDKYKVSLEDVPEIWDEGNKAVERTRDGFQDIVTAIGVQTAQLTKQVKAQETMRREVDKTNNSMTNLARSTTKVAGGIKDITLNLLKWSGISGLISGAIGSVGLSSYMSMARGAGTERRAAMGYGVSQNELQAAQAVYGTRMGNVSGTLERIAEARSDPGRRAMWAAQLGMDPAEFENLSNTELMSRIFAAGGAQYRAFPRGMETTMAEARGFTDIMSLPEWRTAAGMSPEEHAAARAELERQTRAGGASDATSRRYQDFLTRMEGVFNGITNTLRDSFVSLADPITKLTNAFGELLKAGLESPDFREGINKFAEYIKDMARTLSSPGALQGIRDFISAIGDAVRWLRSWFPDSADAGSGTISGDDPNPHLPVDRSLLGRIRRDREFLRQREEQDTRPWLQRNAPWLERFGWQFRASPASFSGGGNFLDSLMSAESGGNPNARNALSSATGQYQFTEGTWLSVARRYGGARVAGLTNAQLLALRSDPAFSREMAAAHTHFDLMPEMQRRGTSISDLSLYAGWHFGAAGGSAVMNAPGGMAMRDLLSRDALAANPYLQNLTAGQWRQRFAGRFSDQGSTFAAGPGGSTVMAQPGQAVTIRVTDATGGNAVNIATGLGGLGLAI